MTLLFTHYTKLVSMYNPTREISMDTMVNIIRDGELKKVVNQIRNTGSKKEYSNLKKYKLGCVTLSGTFGKRRNNTLVQHSGLIQIDIDDLQASVFTSTFNTLSLDRYTMACFRSPGGNGIKAVVKLNPSAETHLGQFYALEKYYKLNFGITIDAACKDVARAMLLSYDPDIFYNPSSDVFDEICKPGVMDPHQNNHPAKPKAFCDSPDDKIELVEKITSELEESEIDITTPYNNWIKIGFALCDTFGPAGITYFQRISAMHPEYDQQECIRVYNGLLQKESVVGLGTLVFLAKQNGVEVRKPTQKSL